MLVAPAGPHIAADSGDARREGKYVKCIGNIRLFQGKRNIGANMIRLVKDPNQIMFHYLQVIQTHQERQQAAVRPSSHLRRRVCA